MSTQPHCPIELTGTFEKGYDVFHLRNGMSAILVQNEQAAPLVRGKLYLCHAQIEGNGFSFDGDAILDYWGDRGCLVPVPITPHFGFAVEADLEGINLLGCRYALEVCGYVDAPRGSPFSYLVR